ncbi:MAG: SDR family NAD(P)-dependent oxidoreductase [Methylocystis sp.]
MSGKHILITGASSGIGRALALRYAQDGALLSLFGRDVARLEASARACRDKGAEVVTFAVDVRDRAEMARGVSEALARAPLDIVFANAGVATGLSPGEIMEDPEAVRATLAINLIGVFNTVEPTIEAMAKRGSGTIAMVGSMAGVRGLPYSPAYSASKAAVYSYAEAMRGVLSPRGVDVCMIVPGFVATPMAAATKSWQPGIISDTAAADIVARGVERRKPVIAFPLYMWCALRLAELLPPRWIDAIMSRFTADVPTSREKEATL